MKTLLTIILSLAFLSGMAQIDTSRCCWIVSGAITPPSGVYTIERVVRMNLTNEYETAAQLPSSPRWNMCNPTVLAIQSAGGYVNSSLVDETGAVVTGWSMTNLTAFGGTTGSAPTPLTTGVGAANTGLFASDAIISYGWIMPPAGDMTIRLTGLLPGKSYQVFLLANNENWKHSLVKIYVGAIQSAAINSDWNYGAAADNEYTASYVCKVKNAHCTSGGVLDIGINSSNTNNPFLVSLVIQQTNIDNPN